MASKTTTLSQRHSQNSMGSPSDRENDLASIELIESGGEEMKGPEESGSSLPYASSKPSRGAAVWSKVEGVVNSPRFRPTAKRVAISTAALLVAIPFVGFIVYFIVVKTLTAPNLNITKLAIAGVTTTPTGQVNVQVVADGQLVNMLDLHLRVREGLVGLYYPAHQPTIQLLNKATIPTVNLSPKGKADAEIKMLLSDIFHMPSGVGNKLTTQAFGREASEFTIRGHSTGEVSMFRIWFPLKVQVDCDVTTQWGASTPTTACRNKLQYSWWHPRD